MTSPTKDSSINHHHDSSSITNHDQQQEEQEQEHDDDDDVIGSPKINNPIIRFGSSSSPDPTQANETQTPTSQTQPLSPTTHLITSSGGVCEIASHVIDLPSPPPLLPPAASSVVASSGRKRGRPRKESSSGGDGESSSTPHKLLRGRTSTGTSTEQLPIKCVVCGREFSTDKAYFGHLRKHPDRQWRGAYPPPVPAQVKKLGSTLLELANQTIARMSGTSGPSSSSSTRKGSMGINLNNPPPPPPPRDDGDGALPFDLNMPPPPENDDDEEEEDPPTSGI